MTAWSRSLMTASLFLGFGTLLVSEQLPQWAGPVAVLAMVLASCVFLTCSILEYRCGRARIGIPE